MNSFWEKEKWMEVMENFKYVTPNIQHLKELNINH